MINVGTLAKIRRMHLRDGLPIKEIERRTGLARNTIKVWLRKGEMVQPKYPQRVVVSKLDGFTEMLATWLKADQHRGKRDRRTIKAPVSYTHLDVYKRQPLQPSVMKPRARQHLQSQPNAGTKSSGSRTQRSSIPRRSLNRCCLLYTSRCV